MVSTPPKRVLVGVGEDDVNGLGLPGEIEIRFPASFPLTDDLFYEFLAANDDLLTLERSSAGGLVIVPSPAIWSANAESILGIQLGMWVQQAGGKFFGPGVSYRLPDGAARQADASWLSEELWEQLGRPREGAYLHSAPTFVIEVRSEGQALASQHRKMAAWIANGAGLGWLIEPNQGMAWVYRPGRAVEELERPSSLSGEPELSGFEADLSLVWK